MSCVDCGVPLPPEPGRHRDRQRCPRCKYARKLATVKAWDQAHPDAKREAKRRYRQACSSI
jgi:hypothetical protein